MYRSSPRVFWRAVGMSDIFVHPTAVVSDQADIGAGTKIWMNVQVREQARIGKNCIVARNAYIDHGVTLGDNCKIQDSALVFFSATLEDGVFVGPGAILTNDKLPRAVNPDGSLKSTDDWQIGHIQVGRGASVGAGATILTNVTIGAWAMIAAGALVTKDVPAHALVVGVPARIAGYVCMCGQQLISHGHNGDRVWICTRDSSRYRMIEKGNLEELRVTNDQ
jgi:UDP-2-acetamido-3-amino-2,3-dideoxy-glucuronate N-acetyltransferase